jgi:hypothetical protein
MVIDPDQNVFSHLTAEFCSENVGLRESVTTKNPPAACNYTAELRHGNGGVH